MKVYGPNGFFREFRGGKNDAAIEAKATYAQSNNKPTGSVILQIVNKASQSQTVVVTDNSYKTGTKEQSIDAGASKEIIIDTGKAFGWYDLSIKLKASPNFERRYAGHVETGLASKTDPLMGRVI